MTTINCNNSERKSVKFFNNGTTIMVFALEDGEYWFTIGDGYTTEAGAKRGAVKKMAKYGYTFDEKEMKNLTANEFRQALREPESFFKSEEFSEFKEIW